MVPLGSTDETTPSPLGSTDETIPSDTDEAVEFLNEVQPGEGGIDPLLGGDSDETISAESEASDSQSDTDMAGLGALGDNAESIFLGDSWFEVSNSQNQKSPKPDKVYPLPCNLFTTGATNVCLVEHSCPRKACHSEIEYNAVRCQDALRQKIPPGLDVLKFVERINMVQQLPDLGVLVIATQAGRVGLLTLTYWPAEQRYGFRIEAILPFKSQEAKGIRPGKPLLGMAVGPVQGCERKVASPSNTDEQGDFLRTPPEVEGRYRLIMMYYDHTVLSYEVSRSDGAGDLLVV